MANEQQQVIVGSYYGTVEAVDYEIEHSYLGEGDISIASDMQTYYVATIYYGHSLRQRVFIKFDNLSSVDYYDGYFESQVGSIKFEDGRFTGNIKVYHDFSNKDLVDGLAREYKWDMSIKD